MFRFLQRKKGPQKFAPDPGTYSLKQLVGDANLPISIKAVSELPADPQRRIIRILLPTWLLTQFDIKPISWKGAEGDMRVEVITKSNPGLLHLSAKQSSDQNDPFFTIELQDNVTNGIDLNLIVLSNPNSPRYHVDMDEEGLETYFGKMGRNLAEEERAMEAGLAPGQIHAGLKASKEVFQQLETFLTMLGHYAVFLEPLTYASAWVFERRGFAYVRGHQMMDEIHREFLPGGRLHQALDGSTAFRQPDQWRSVRGRAWAIHDGVLEEIGLEWDRLRMVKRVGYHGGVNTFPEATY